MSLFDTDNFLGSSAGGAMSTERELIPADTYTDASIADMKLLHGEVKQGENAGNKWARINFIWEIHNEELKTKLDRSVIKVTQGIMLDLTPSGDLDTSKGKNVRLGKLKHALRMNDRETQWQDFIGKRAIITVTHGVNSKDNSPTEEVSNVAGQ